MNRPNTTPAWILELRARVEAEKQAKKQAKIDARKAKEKERAIAEIERAKTIAANRMLKRIRKQDRPMALFQERLMRDRD